MKHHLKILLFCEKLIINKSPSAFKPKGWKVKAPRRRRFSQLLSE
jgi:hypothetical protein